MRVQLINMDKFAKKTLGLYSWQIFEVIEERVISVGRKHPSCIKEFVVKNPKSSTGKTILYYDEVRVL